MKVWIIEKESVWDGDSYGICGVYISKELCLKKLESYSGKFDYDEYEVEE